MAGLHVKDEVKLHGVGVSAGVSAGYGGLSVRAEWVMRALEDGALLQWGVTGGEAGWWLEGEDVTVAVAGLLARDLVCRAADGVGRLSVPGVAWLRRRASADRAGRALLEGDAVAVGLAMPFRDQHQAVVVSTKSGERRWANLGESPLGWLRRRRDRHGVAMLAEGQFLAGERLRSDFERAGIPARVTRVWSGLGTVVDGGGGQGFSGSETQMRSRARFERAVVAMGQGLSDVVVRVACYQEGLSAVEEGLGWPARSAKVVLLLGLDRLCEFYDIGKK